MQHATTFLTGLLNRPYVHGWELRRGITQLVQYLTPKAQNNGWRSLRLEWVEMETAAITDTGHLMLPAVRDDAKVSRAQFVRYVGFVIHEILHWAYTDFKARDGRPYVDRLHNAVEDAWIERRGIAAGLTGNIAAVLTGLVDQIVAEALRDVTDWADPRQYPFALAVYCRRYGARVPVADGLAPIFAEAERRIDSAQSSQDTLAIAQWVYDQLQNLPKQEQQQEQQGGGEQQDGQQGEQTGPARRPTSTESREVEPTSGVTEEQRGPAPGRSDVGSDHCHVAINEHRAVSVNVPARLRYEVRKMFEDTGYTAFTRGRRSGSVNVAALHRAGFDDRVFQQRRDVDGIHSAVMIVVDVSGSMGGARLDSAAQVTYALAESLRAAEVPVGVVTFGSQASTALPIGAPLPKIREVCASMTVGGGTNDAAGVRLAMDTLLPRAEGRKVIFVITDGCGCEADVRSLCASADALGITVIGIGIGEQTVRRVYPNAVVLNSVENLGEVCFKQIKLAA